MASLPSNVRVSQHPCLQAKLSQLRAKSTSPRDVKALIHEISLIVSCEALAKAVTPVQSSKVAQHCAYMTSPQINLLNHTLNHCFHFQDVTPLGFEFSSTTIEPATMCLVPILRSGLGMVEGAFTYLSYTKDC